MTHNGVMDKEAMLIQNHDRTSLQIMTYGINLQRIQTHKRLKRTLFIRTKYNRQNFGVIPFFMLKNKKLNKKEGGGGGGGGITLTIPMLCFVLINCILFNLFMCWDLVLERY